MKQYEVSASQSNVNNTNISIQRIVLLSNILIKTLAVKGETIVVLLSIGFVYS